MGLLLLKNLELGLLELSRNWDLLQQSYCAIFLKLEKASQLTIKSQERTTFRVAE